MGFASHLRKHDHWTFLIGFGLVGANVAINSRFVSGIAFAFLLAALVYDTAEYLDLVAE